MTEDFKKIDDKIIVIKYGGHAMVDAQLKKDFAEDIIAIQNKGMKPVIVHGGGPQINRVLKQLQITSEFVKGMRVTDSVTMEVVEMALCGNVNKSIAAEINQLKPIAVGISGKDANLICAEKLMIDETIDIGLVGKVKKINPEIINILIENNFIPIIAPIGIGEDNLTYNINADIAASGIASALCAEYLILVTDVEGVLDSKGSLIPIIEAKDIKDMIERQIITEGMIPKINCALSAFQNGVKKVRIINGKKRHILATNFIDFEETGTEIKI